MCVSLKLCDTIFIKLCTLAKKRLKLLLIADLILNYDIFILPPLTIRREPTGSSQLSGLHKAELSYRPTSFSE